MAKDWKDKLADIQAPRGPRPDGLALGDYMARHAGLVVPDGFPGGTVSPLCVPDGEARESIRGRLAEDFKRMDHDALARAAALLLEGSMMWRSVFANYAKDKDIELSETKTQMNQRLYDANAEALDVLADPGTRGHLNAMARLAKDPKQAAKAEAFDRWKDWQGGKTLHKSGAAFHRYVCGQFPVITSTKTVERWCREWLRARNRD